MPCSLPFKEGLFFSCVFVVVFYKIEDQGVASVEVTEDENTSWTLIGEFVNQLHPQPYLHRAYFNNEPCDHHYSNIFLSKTSENSPIICKGTIHYTLRLEHFLYSSSLDRIFSVLEIH